MSDDSQIVNPIDEIGLPNTRETKPSAKGTGPRFTTPYLSQVFLRITCEQKYNKFATCFARLNESFGQALKEQPVYCSSVNHKLKNQSLRLDLQALVDTLKPWIELMVENAFAKHDKLQTCLIYSHKSPFGRLA